MGKTSLGSATFNNSFKKRRTEKIKFMKPWEKSDSRKFLTTSEHEFLAQKDKLNVEQNK